MCVLAVVVRSYLQVHQLELESLGQQIRENKRNGRLVRTSLTSGGLLGRCCSVQPIVDWKLCDAKLFPFFWQGSLYEQDKVSFINGCRLTGEFPRASQCLMMLFSPPCSK